MNEELIRPTPPRLAYSVNEAARATGICRTTLFKLIGNGVLPSVKIGKRRVIRAADLDNLLATGSAPA